MRHMRSLHLRVPILRYEIYSALEKISIILTVTANILPMTVSCELAFIE